MIIMFICIGILIGTVIANWVFLIKFDEIIKDKIEEYLWNYEEIYNNHNSNSNIHNIEE